MSDAARQVAEAAAAVRQPLVRSAQVGVILGTGLGQLAEHVRPEAVFPYRDLPHFPSSTALSHRSLLVCGQLEGRRVITMQGRCHRYEGYSIDQLALPVRVMAELGVRTLIVSNASGGLNPSYRAGDVMIQQDHINLMWSSPRGAEPPHAWGRPAAKGTPAYDDQLMQNALEVARRERFRAHCGVYVAVTGPTYETRAEYRMFRKLGGDVVGMSTVPEVIAARQCGMRVLALSLVTNVANPDAPEVVTAEEVVQAAATAAPHMQKIVQDAIRG